VSIVISEKLALALAEIIEQNAEKIDDEFGACRPAYQLVRDDGLPEEYYQLLDALKISAEDRAAALREEHERSMRL